jgi:hypothetical protein
MPNLTKTSSGATCVIGGSLPIAVNESMAAMDDEIFTCSASPYSDVGVWCGLVRFASMDCSGEPVWRRYDRLVDSCDVQLEGTYWKIFTSNDSHLMYCSQPALESRLTSVRLSVLGMLFICNFESVPSKREEEEGKVGLTD